MTRSFTDTAGRDWHVAINVAAVKAVRDEADVDLLSVGEGDLLARLSTDAVLLAAVLFVVCRRQADDRGVTAEDFGRALAGDVIADATEAFLRELAAFFPHRRRLLLEAALDKAAEVDGLVVDHAAAGLADPKLIEAIRTELAAVDVVAEARSAMRRTAPPSGGAASTDSPARSGSTPAR